MSPTTHHRLPVHRRSSGVQTDCRVARAATALLIAVALLVPAALVVGTGAAAFGAFAVVLAWGALLAGAMVAPLVVVAGVDRFVD